MFIHHNNAIDFEMVIRVVAIFWLAFSGDYHAYGHPWWTCDYVRDFVKLHLCIDDKKIVVTSTYVVLATNASLLWHRTLAHCMN